MPQIENVLAEAIRFGEAKWPANSDAASVLLAIDYHGVAGLLNDRVLSAWPDPVCDNIRRRAIAQAMWELRHRSFWIDLLERFQQKEVRSLFLKGTAFAYELYPNPSDRARGDSDLLVPTEHLDRARAALNEARFVREPASDNPDAQESWVAQCEDGSRHVIDLHWQVLNAPALYGLLSFDDIATSQRPLPRLSKLARSPSFAMMFAHACVHRSIHDCSPYFVGRRTYFGGDRLIWLFDLALLGRAMTDADWQALADFAVEKGISGICLEGIRAAEERFGAFCPEAVRTELSGRGSRLYLRSGQLGRAALDLWAVPGPAAKSRYALARLLPSARFMRDKYGAGPSKPLPLLYLRRVADLVRRRPTRDFS